MKHKAQWRRLVASLLAASMLMAAPFTANAAEELPLPAENSYADELSPLETPPEEEINAPVLPENPGSSSEEEAGDPVLPETPPAEGGEESPALPEVSSGEEAPTELSDEENEAGPTDLQAAPLGYGYLGVKTEAKVYDDFENDLWLQYQQREMTVGDTAVMYPWRVPQVISNAITNDVQRPVFHFAIIAGDSVTLDSETTTTSVTVTAVKPGTTVVQVTYDPVSYGGKDWGGVSPVNTAYVVYTVGETGSVEPEISEDLKNWRLYDTIYYNEGETVPFTFTAEAPDAASLEVTLNGEPVTGEDGEYTVNLENRSNIIGVVATDGEGNTKSVYRVVDARFMEVNVINKARPGEELLAGDTATVSFRGIVMPVYKLATIYNPQMGSNATRVVYKNEALGEFTGKCRQWDLATRNSFDVSFTKAGSYRFTSENGIYCAWWGSPLGTEATMNGSGEPNLSAPTLEGWFGSLPDFTIRVGESVPVTQVLLDKTSLELKLGEEAQLFAQVVPENATHSAVTWSSSDGKVVSVSAEGKVTALHAGTAAITATAGGVTAECAVTVPGVPLDEAEAAIGAIPDPESLTLRDKALVDAARQLYDNLSAGDKEAVDASRLTAAEEKLEPLLKNAPFLFSLDGKLLPMEAGEENAYRGRYYKVTVPAGTKTVQIERFKDVTVQNAKYDTLTPAGTATVDIAVEGRVGKDNYFILNHDMFWYNYIFFEEEEPPQGKIQISFTLLGDDAHGDLPDGEAPHTLAGGGLQTWIDEPEYLAAEGATVGRVLEELLEKYGMTAVNSGNYISSITKDGVELGEFTNGSLSGWMFTLNGEHGGLGLDEQVLKEGDVVVFHYTDDFSLEYEAVDEAAESVENLIQALPETDALTLDHAEAVLAAKAAYDALPQSSKENISGESLKKLQAAAEKIRALQAEKPEEPDNPDPPVDPDAPKEDLDVSAVLDRTLSWIYDNTPAPSIGTLGGEWSVMALVGGGYASDSWLKGYYDRVVAELKENKGILSGDRKFTEYSRVILGLTAAGYNPISVGGYNLVEKLAEFDKVVKQGVNGPIWALIALDSKGYSTSDPDIRQKYMDEILSKEISGGGFSLTGGTPDPDVTAMAIQALTPYRGNSAVNAAILRAVSVLSSMQMENGGLGHEGAADCEAICQTIIALCGLDINPHTDPQFIKNGHSLLDALLTFEVSGGGFMHVHKGDNAGGGSAGGVADGMPTDQAALALLAYQRLTEGAPPIYDNSGTTSRQPEEEEIKEEETPLASGPVAKEYPSKDGKGTWTQYESGAWTLTSSEGQLLTGWQKVDGNWYFFRETGEMLTGRQEIGGKTYFLKDWGGMRTGWFVLDGQWYHCASGGELLDAPASLPMVASSSVSADNTGRWQRHTDGRWSFADENGLATGWRKIDGSWYFFDTAHAMATGWQYINDSWYYLSGSGAMATGWLLLDGSWYYLNSSGAMATGWLWLGGSWYYLDAGGVMLTGQITVDGMSYLLDASGRLVAE